jgi:hypothetical protein
MWRKETQRVNGQRGFTKWQTEDVSRTTACPPAFEILVEFPKIPRPCVNDHAQAEFSTEIEAFVMPVASAAAEVLHMVLEPALPGLWLKLEWIIVPLTVAIADHLGKRSLPVLKTVQVPELLAGTCIRGRQWGQTRTSIHWRCLQNRIATMRHLDE